MSPGPHAEDDLVPEAIDATGEVALADLVRRLEAALARAGTAVLRVPDPDGGLGLWPGERRPDGERHRSWRAWADLADGLGAFMGTPRTRRGGLVEVRFTRLPDEAPLQAEGGGGGDPVPGERYGRRAAFSRLSKLEHPGFLLPFLEALGFARPPDASRVLVLGCHHGDEIAGLGLLHPPPRGLRVTGVDIAGEVLEHARHRLPETEFVQADVNDLPPAMGRFETIVAIGLLQSPGVDDRRLLRTLVQEHAAPGCGMILGFPNGRFRGGEAVYGARTRNYREVDLSLVVKDLAHHRRYLHQHGFRTRIGGRYDLLLSAVRGRGEGSPRGHEAA